MKVRVTAPTRVAFRITAVGLSFALNIISVREVTPELHILEAVLFRCLFGMVFMVTWLIKVGKIVLKTSRPTLAMTLSVFAYFVSRFYFLASTLVPSADMVSITFTQLMFGIIAAIVVLHEVAQMKSLKYRYGLEQP